MNMKWQRVVAAICIVALAAPLTAAAQDQDRANRDPSQQQSQKQQTQQQSEQQQSEMKHDQRMSMQRGDLRSANDMIGMPIRNANGEQIAEIDDFVLDRDQNRVAYAIVSYGGFVGVGDTLCAVPWRAFETTSTRHLTLNVDKERLKKAPKLEGGRLPDAHDPNFHRELHAFYKVEPYRLDKERSEMKSQRESAREGQIQRPRLDESQEAEVEREVRGNRSEKSEGEARQDRELAQRQEEQRQDRQQAREMNEDFDWRFWSNRDDENWSRRLSELIGANIKNNRDENFAELEDVLIDTSEGRIAYALVSYGQTLGFFGDTAAVPWRALEIDEVDENFVLAATVEDLKKVKIDAKNFDQLEDQEYAQRVHKTFGKEPYWVAYGYTVGMTPEREQSRQGQQRGDAGEQIQISGTIESVGSLTDEENNVKDGARIRVRSNDGQYHTVHIASREKLKKENIDLSRGDYITVTGDEKQYRGYKVVDADEIKANGRTVRITARASGAPRDSNTESLDD